MSDFACVLCPPGRLPRVPQFPPVCQACRLWLAHVLNDLSALAEELAADPDIVPDARLAPIPHPGRPGKAANERGPLVFDVSRQAWLRPALRDGAGRIAVRHRDPVAFPLPSGSAGRRASAPTSGSREPAIPINVDAVDILAEARPASRRLMARGVLGLDGDQIGHLSLATALDAWVRDWRACRRAGEGLPPATVCQMLRWLSDRCAWGCDQHPDISSFAAEVADYRAVIRGLLGLVDVPDWRKGVACRQCGTFALYRRVGGPADGRLLVECAACPALMEWDDYLAWTRDGAATVCPDCGHLPDLHQPATVKPLRPAGCRMCACRRLPDVIAALLAGADLASAAPQASRFALADLLSVLAGRCLTPAGVGGLRDLLAHLLGEAISPEQIPTAMDACRSALAAQFPELARAARHMPRLESQADHVAWLVTQTAAFGPRREVDALRERVHAAA